MTPVNFVNQSVHPSRNQQLRSLANKMETQFLAEMMKSAGVGKARESFGGGAGEDHFSSFLANEYAAATVRAGGIGLSEAIFQTLIAKETNK